MDRFFDISTIFSKLSNDRISQSVFIGVLLVFWTILYVVINCTFNWKSLSVKESKDVNKRLIAIVYGLIIFWLATYEYFSPSHVLKYFYDKFK